MSEGYPANQEVEKSGGAPVEEGPATTPDEALEQGDDDSREQRPDSDQGGHEPDQHGGG